MFVVDLTFDCYQDTTLEQAEQAINRLVNALRFNGQIIGEEFPTVLKDGYFITRVMFPTELSRPLVRLQPIGRCNDPL